MGWKRFEEYLEPQADALLTRFVSWRRTALIVGLALFASHLTAFILGVLVSG